MPVLNKTITILMGVIKMSGATVFFKLIEMLPLGSILPAGMASLASQISGILLMGASAWLITSAAYHPPLYTLAIGITLVRACGLGRAVFRYLERWLSHKAVFSMLTWLRVSFYKRAAQRFPLKNGHAREGELLHDLGTGCNVLRDFYLRVLAPPLYSLLLTIPVIFLLWPLVGMYSLLILLCWIICLLPAYFVAARSEERESAADSAYRDSLLEWQGGCCELVASGSRKIAEKRMGMAAKELRLLHLSRQREENLCRALAMLAEGSVLIAIIFQLAVRVYEGQLTGIETAVWLLVLLSLMEGYRELPSAAREWHRTLTTSRRVLTKEPTQSPLASDTTLYGNAENNGAILRAEKLSFSYLPFVPILNNLSLSLPEGQHMALLGESGAGKSTFLFLLLGLWEPDEGRVLLKEKNVRDYTFEELAHIVTASTASNHLFNLSIRDNFQILHPDISEEKIWEYLRLCLLSELVEAMPEKLETSLGENANILSGGERVRLRLALALAGETPILLLDEPTANLDRENAQKLMDNILCNAKRKTLLIVTHDLPLAERMNFIYNLDKGNV